MSRRDTFASSAQQSEARTSIPTPQTSDAQRADATQASPQTGRERNAPITHVDEAPVLWLGDLTHGDDVCD